MFNTNNDTLTGHGTTGPARAGSQYTPAWGSAARFRHGLRTKPSPVKRVDETRPENEPPHAGRAPPELARPDPDPLTGIKCVLLKNANGQLHAVERNSKVSTRLCDHHKGIECPLGLKATHGSACSEVLTCSLAPLFTLSKVLDPQALPCLDSLDEADRCSPV